MSLSSGDFMLKYNKYERSPINKLDDMCDAREITAKDLINYVINQVGWVFEEADEDLIERLRIALKTGRGR